jgi:N-glycosylase/DNA lyase
MREILSKVVGTGRATRKLLIQSKQRQIQFYKSYLETLRRVTTDATAEGTEKMSEMVSKTVGTRQIDIRSKTRNYETVMGNYTKNASTTSQ